MKDGNRKDHERNDKDKNDKDKNYIKLLIERLNKASEESSEELIKDLINLFYLEIENFAKIDHMRDFRAGKPEAIYAENKDPVEVLKMVKEILKHSDGILITRANEEHIEVLEKELSGIRLQVNRKSGTVIAGNKKKRTGGRIAIITAGTSDIPVAEEAATTADFLGIEVKRYYDVGVAGIHRLIEPIRDIIVSDVDAIVVVAGMEGALPSVIAGLVNIPVIAVPTSVGYGTNLGGITTLFAMLQSCSSGVAVVNIDNGFGAAVFASMICKRRYGGARK